MKLVFAIMAGSAAWALAPSPALAQAAAETATVTAGTGTATARGSRSMGSAIGGAMRGAASRIRGRGPAPRPRRAASSVPVVIGTGDVLENSDAPIHHIEGGATIRVSGHLRPRPTGASTNAKFEGQPAPPAD